MSTVIEAQDTRIAARAKKTVKQSEKSQIPPQAAPAYSPRTALGHKLWLLRQQMVASGSSLLSWNELEDEIAERRG